MEDKLIELSNNLEYVTPAFTTFGIVVSIILGLILFLAGVYLKKKNNKWWIILILIGSATLSINILQFGSLLF